MDYAEIYESAVKLVRESELNEFPDLADALIAQLAPAIQVEFGDIHGGECEVGLSKLGGRPDLPSNFQWPQWNKLPLTFIGQFNLSQLALYDVENALPDHGLLSFWSMLRPMSFPDDADMHAAIGGELETKGAWRVLWSPQTEYLNQLPPPPGFENILYPCAPVKGIWNTISFPDSYSVELKGLIERYEAEHADDEEAENISELFWDVRDQIDALSEKPWHGDAQLLGNAWFIQDEMRDEAIRFEHEPSQATQQTPEWQQRVKVEAPQWRLLLQIWSSGDYDLSFAGDGCGYFFTNTESLTNQRFDKTYFGVQR